MSCFHQPRRRGRKQGSRKVSSRLYLVSRFVRCKGGSRGANNQAELRALFCPLLVPTQRHSWLLPPGSQRKEWRLTPRSTGAPTAGHQRPVGCTRYIFTARALASCRRRPVTSNVRPQLERFLPLDLIAIFEALGAAAQLLPSGYERRYRPESVTSIAAG
jgi:hypothetical protein